MRKIAHFILVFLMLSLVGVTSAQSQQTNQATVEAHLMRYINALNLRDYATAYNMWANPTQTYDDFVAGFSETERIVPYFGRAGVATGSVYVTTILLGYQTDMSIETYYGYFRLANGGNYSPPIEGWVMTGSRFQLIQDGIAMHNSTMQSLLSTEWHENPEMEIFSTIGEMGDIHSRTLFDYYDLINTNQFGLAYQQWLSPYTNGLSTDYRLPYNQFVSGYGDTVYVTVYTGGYQVPHFKPTVLIGQHSDGSFVTYYGCYAFGLLNAHDLGIINGRFYLLQNDVANAATIFNIINTLDCASLGMGTS